MILFFSAVALLYLSCLVTYTRFQLNWIYRSFRFDAIIDCFNSMIIFSVFSAQVDLIFSIRSFVRFDNIIRRNEFGRTSFIWHSNVKKKKYNFFFGFWRSRAENRKQLCVIHKLKSENETFSLANQYELAAPVSCPAS